MRALILLLAFLSLAGCGTVLDGDQIRICRQTLPAINPDTASIVVTGITGADNPYTVRIDYRVIIIASEKSRTIWCGFASDELSADRGLLAHFATEDGPYSALKVHLLNRYWLQKPALSTPADPGSGFAATPLLRAPPGITYFAQALVNALPQTAITVLLAAAYALIYGLVGRINLAFGELAVLGSYGAIVGIAVGLQFGFGSIGAGLTFAALFAIAISAIYGRVMERLVFTPLVFAPGQSILVATIALAIALQDYLRLAQGVREHWLPPLLSASFPLAGGDGFVATITPMQLLVTGFASLFAAALLWLMHASPFGRRWRATADDPIMAPLLGVSSKTILAQTFMLASASAGAAGSIMTLYYGNAGFAAGTMMGLKALTAAVMGGIGSVGGAALGGLMIGLFEAVWSAYLPIEQRDLAVLVLLVVMLWIKPGGLFGYSDNRPRTI